MSLSSAVQRVTRRIDPSAIWFAARINAYGIVLAALWTPLNTLVLPDLVAAVAPSALRGSALGLARLLGTGLGAVVQPIAGRVSDRAPLHDRRRPFIVAPSLLALLWLAGLWWSSAYLWILLGYVLLQLTLNVSQAAFQGLIPDLVDKKERGLASGVKSGMNVAGVALGLAVAGGLLSLTGGDGAVLLFFALVLVAGAAEVIIGVPRVPPLPPDERAESLWAPLSIGSIHQAFGQMFHAPRAFRLAVLARFLFLLGAYPVQTFLLYFLSDRFDLTHPGARAAVYVLAGTVFAAGGAGVAGLLTDRIGARGVLVGAAIIGAAGIAGIAFAPALGWLILPGALVAIGFGAFLGANWALLSRSIPEAEAAQFLGLANIATAGAGALAGLLGPVVDLANAVLPGGTYVITFGLSALVALTCLIPLWKLGNRGGGAAAGRGRGSGTPSQGNP